MLFSSALADFSSNEPDYDSEFCPCVCFAALSAWATLKIDLMIERISAPTWTVSQGLDDMPTDVRLPTQANYNSPLISAPLKAKPESQTRLL